MVPDEIVDQKIQELEVVRDLYIKERANADIERYVEFYNARLVIIEEHLAVLRWVKNGVQQFELHWENKEWLTLQRM